MKHAGYRTRAMQARDPRYAQIFDVLDGVGNTAPPEVTTTKPKPPAAPPKPDQAAPAAESGKDDLTALRAEYEATIGKRPFMGWDAETLQQKISEHRALSTPDDQNGDTEPTDEE